MKFGGYVGNELPQGVEWSKHVSFENPIWQMAAMHHTCNLAFWEFISVPDQNIFTKFGGYVDNGLPNVWNGPNMIPSKIQFGRWQSI